MWKELLSQKQTYYACKRLISPHRSPLPVDIRHPPNVVFFASAKSKKWSVMITIQYSIKFQLLAAESDPNGRFLILSAILNNQTLVLANIYTPHVSHIFFFILKRKNSNIHQLIIWGALIQS